MGVPIQWCSDHMYDILQYSPQGILCQIQVFNNGDIYNYFPFINTKFSYYFYDIDGDDKLEIVYQRRARSSIYTRSESMKFTERILKKISEYKKADA